MNRQESNKAEFIALINSITREFDKANLNVQELIVLKEVKLEKLDYLKTFNDFILDSLGNNNIIRDELNRICM